MIDRHESRVVISEIRRILLEVWDPIGVKHVANAQDEYDSYIGGVYHLLASGASDQSLQDHLWRVVTEQIGLSGAKKEDMAHTVTALRGIVLPGN